MTPTNEIFNYRALRRYIKSVSGMKVPEWLVAQGMPELRTAVMYRALTIVKLRRIMEALELPVPYFFTQYQELLSEYGYAHNQLAQAHALAQQLPPSPQAQALITLLSESLQEAEEDVEAEENTEGDVGENIED